MQFLAIGLKKNVRDNEGSTHRIHWVLALIFLIAIKLFSINYLLDFQMEYILLIYPVVGRISSVASCSFSKYAESGMSNFINK